MAVLLERMMQPNSSFITLHCFYTPVVVEGSVVRCSLSDAPQQ